MYIYSKSNMKSCVTIWDKKAVNSFTQVTFYVHKELLQMHIFITTVYKSAFNQNYVQTTRISGICAYEYFFIFNELSTEHIISFLKPKQRRIIYISLMATGIPIARRAVYPFLLFFWNRRVYLHQVIYPLTKETLKERTNRINKEIRRQRN